MSKQTTRRAVMAGVAAVPALSIPALASDLEVDPVFAAIERYRAATKAYEATVLTASALEDVVPKERRRWHPTAWEPERPADCSDAPEWISAQIDQIGASKAEADALLALVATVPTTQRGMAALFVYLNENLDELSECFTGFDEDGNATFASVPERLVENFAATFRRRCGAAITSDNRSSRA